jgi:hypothetical protein
MGTVVYSGGRVLRGPGDKEVDHVLRSSAVVKNGWSYNSPPPIRLHDVNRFSFYFSMDGDDVKTIDRDD